MTASRPQSDDLSSLAFRCKEGSGGLEDQVSVRNPLGNELAEYLANPFSLAVRERGLNAEVVHALLLTFRQDARYISKLFSHFSNAAGSRLLTNLKPEVRDRIYSFLYMDEKKESDSGKSYQEEERR